MDIEQLVVQAQQGDQLAFMQVCRQFEGLVKKYACQAHLRSLGEDAQAEGRLALVQAIVAYDMSMQVHFAGYAESKVKYALWNLFKRERRKWQQEYSLDACQDDGEGAALIGLLADGCDIAAETEKKQERQMVRQALSRLPERQRQAIAGTVLSEEKLADVAANMGVTAQAVHNLQKRGLARLKKAYAGMYHSERG